MTYDTVVIGLGNPLMGDDGLGLAALEALREGWDFEPHLELMDGGTWGMNLLPFIESADRVLILDAIKANAAPGTLLELDRDQIPRFLATKISSHQIDFREVLALAELRGTLPAELVALGVQPDAVEMSAELTPVVRERVPALLERALERLELWGYRVTRRAAAPGV